MRRVLPFLMICLVGVSAFAADGAWEWVTPLPQGHDLCAATAGDGVTVVVGRKGTVITSLDGGA